jgi:hypothetical protein
MDSLAQLHIGYKVLSQQEINKKHSILNENSKKSYITKYTCTRHDKHGDRRA